MARKPNPSKEIVELPAISEQGINEVMNTMTTIQSEYSHDRDIVNQLIGEARLAGGFYKFSKTVFISKLAFVKENKLYQSIRGMKTEDNLHLKGTWDEFCQLLELTPQHANEMINNLKVFGEDALNSMSKIGLGYRELRQYRKLPEDQKTALIEVAKAGDKEALVELAEEFITKNDKEKALLKKQVDDAKKELEISEAYNADTRKERDDLKLKLKKYELNTISIEEQIESLGLYVDNNKEIYNPFKRAINTFNSITDHLQQLELNIMENTPDYQPGNRVTLPNVMVDKIMFYQGLIALMLDDARDAFYYFNDKFGCYIETKKYQINESTFDAITAVENTLENATKKIK